jgi:glycosyltransferase involved in cell wall biosynthesis
LLRRPPVASWEDRAAAKWLAPFSPDLVVISQMTNYDGAAWATACQRHHLRYALIAQAANDSIAPDNHGFEAIQQAYRSAAAAFFVSEHNREFTACGLGEALPQARVVRNPYLVPYQDPPAWPGDEGGLRLACVARLDYGKGHDLLFHALASPAWRERPFHVTLFGDGRHGLSQQAMVDYLGLRQKVTFAGHVSDVRKIWSTHHALVLPSRAEGLPIAMVEATLCERTSIATRAGGIAEIVRDNETGFLADSPTASAFGAALERAWTRRAEWQALGRNAGRHIRTLIPPDPIKVFSEELLALATAPAA